MVNNFQSLKHFFVALLNDASPIVVLAVPLILTHLAHVAVTTVDIIMLGWFGSLEVAAGGLAIVIFNQLRTMGTGLVTSTSNLVASAQAKKNHQQIRALLVASFIVSSAAGAFFAVILLLINYPLQWMAQDQAVVVSVSSYLAILAPAMLPCLWFQSLRHFSVGLSKPGPLLLITLLSVILTVVLNSIFMFGLIGFPALGLLGVAFATSVVMLISFLLLLVASIRHEGMSDYFCAKTRWPSRQLVYSAMVDTWKMGLPIAATYGSEAAFFTVLTLLVGTLGVDALAAQTVVNQIVYIVFMVSAGLSHAASIKISAAYGVANYYLARRLGRVTLFMAVLVMAVIGLFYLFFSHWIISLFLNSASTLSSLTAQLAIGLLAIAALLQVFDACQNIGVGILRGIGDVSSPFKLSIVGYWLIGLPSAYFLGIFLQLNIYGIWYGLMLGLAMTAVLQWWVFEVTLSHVIQKELHCI